jgi:hypothetical protein
LEDKDACRRTFVLAGRRSSVEDLETLSRLSKHKKRIAFLFFAWAALKRFGLFVH